MDIISEFKNRDLYIELHTGKAVNERKDLPIPKDSHNRKEIISLSLFMS